MKTYRIFEHTDGRTVNLKKGWSWPAFFFSLIYCLYYRLWCAFLLILIAIVNVALMTYGFYLTAGLETKVSGTVIDYNVSPAFIGFYGLSYLVICIGLALTANHMRSKKLLKRGFIEEIN